MEKLSSFGVRDAEDELNHQKDNRKKKFNCISEETARKK